MQTPPFGFARGLILPNYLQSLGVCMCRKRGHGPFLHTRPTNWFVSSHSCVAGVVPKPLRARSRPFMTPISCNPIARSTSLTDLDKLRSQLHTAYIHTSLKNRTETPKYNPQNAIRWFLANDIWTNQKTIQVHRPVQVF